MQLGENIFRCRTARNWSQSELADALDVSRQSISKWENSMAVPDLDKLIKMGVLFEITLDELVFGTPTAKASATDGQTVWVIPSARVIAGGLLLIFGMIFFLLSVFWGDHLYFGEAFGELFSSVVVLISVALIATYRFPVLAVCAMIYFVYSIVCFGFLHVTSMTNYLFTFAAGVEIVVWFIICGLHTNQEA